MGRKKKTVDFAQPPVPVYVEPIKPIIKNRKIIYEQGTWQVFQTGFGFVKFNTRAFFKDDPEGCLGYGKTQEEAKKYLRMISRIEDIASRFEKMEGEFSSSDTSGPRKEKIKKRYEKLSKDLEEILKHSPADWKAYFKSIGAYGAIQALTMLILWKMFDFNIYDSPFFEYLTAKVGIAVPALLASWKIGDMSYADDISELLSKLEKKFGNSTN
jgi:hypothetical protein